MPLPVPEPAESRNEFVARCVIDPNVQGDFDTIEQRVAVCQSLYEQEVQVKSYEETFAQEFEKRLNKAEAKQAKIWQKYYQKEYNNASEMFIRQGGKLDSNDINGFFKYDDLKRLYVELYTDMGIEFASWYAKSFEKFTPKGFDISNISEIWSQAFAFVGQTVAAQRVSGVSGTAKKTLIAVTRKIMADPEMQVQNEVVVARALRKDFSRYSNYQAKRLVRTEATFAANYGNLQAAQSIFAGRDLMKKWGTAQDERVRSAHAVAQGQIVDVSKKFSVGGEMLNLPSDPSASAGNRINCRCYTTFIPKANANTIGGLISDIGFGIAVNELTNF